MITFVRPILLPLLVTGLSVSCSVEKEASIDGLVDQRDAQNIAAGDSANVALLQEQPNQPNDKDASTNQMGVAADENGAAQDEPTTGDDFRRPLVNQDTASVKGVEERRSSESALMKGDINFDDLKFDLAKDAPFDPSLITEGLHQLDGRDVTLRGYILPSTLFSETNISQFVLVRDNQECCFGPGAALYDCVMVQMVEGHTTDFVTRPVTVAGRFVIDTESYRYPPGLSPNGATHMAIFRIEGLSVE